MILVARSTLPEGETVSDTFELAMERSTIALEIDRYAWPDAGDATLALTIETIANGGWQKLATATMAGGTLKGLDGAVRSHRISIALLDRRSVGTSFRLKLGAASPLETEIRVLER